MLNNLRLFQTGLMSLSVLLFPQPCKSSSLNSTQLFLKEMYLLPMVNAA